jgi:hypothetical protein
MLFRRLGAEKVALRAAEQRVRSVYLATSAPLREIIL